MASYDAAIKIMLLGDESAEKTSLTIRYMSGFFLEDLKLTIGVDFYSKTINIGNKKIKVQIWDFGGEERFRFLLHQYCKGANAAFFLYDITNRLSLDHLPDWTQIIREHAGDIPIILLGAKAHLKELRAVSKDEGILAAKKYNLSGFIEVSSKTGQNVEKAFEALTRLVLIQPVFCQKCKKEFTFEEFLKHPCYKAGEVLSTGIKKEEYILEDQKRQQFIRDMRKRFDDEDRYPYPYIFKPPKPPDDLSMAARSQLRQPPKKKDTEEKICCQYCGMELTKEDQLTHSCQKKPE